MINVTTWIRLENITLSKECKHKRPTLFDCIYMQYPEQANPQTVKGNSWLPGTGGDGNGEYVLLSMGFFGGDENVLKLIVVIVAQVYEYTKTH